MHKVCFFLLSLVFLQSCSGLRRSNSMTADEFELLDTLVVTASRGYSFSNFADENVADEKIVDLLHVRLDLQFDWKEHVVIGQAELLLTPYFYPQQKIVLDAKNMVIESVLLDSSQTNYAYDGQLLTIDLDKLYHKGEHINVAITYKTNSRKDLGLSPPFNEDLGFYFIASEPSAYYDSPQVWTQGETEYNSNWFPCIDQPNERMTQEIRLTVKDKFTTLSNGLLTEQLQDGKGNRTDVWVLDLPHPVYLAAFAIGEFYVHSEMVNGILYQYFVDSSFAENASAIYAHTPEMVRFFSDITGVEYPWKKYGQVAVKHFVAGAMENTSATIFGNFIEKHPPALYDDPNDAIVAHELFHQWFGDYITCESWANLTLNEGFASYGEYLWAEHKYGYIEAEEIRYGFLMKYLYNAMYEAHPLIHYQYNDKEDMFDAHSYDKGALVLHLLRMHLGDEAFFAGIQHYIQANALTDVEYDELRIAQEEVSGRDLQGFFNQWFNSTGHPDWSVKLTHANDSIHIDIHQDQYMDKGYNLFECPLEIAVYNSSSKKHEYTFDISSEKEHFAIARPDSNSTIHVDPEKKILGRISIEYSQEDYRQIYQNAKHPIARFEAIKSLLPLINSDSTLCSAILSDPYFRIRAFGVRALENPDSSILNQLKELSFEDPHPLVRHESINLLGNYSDDEWLHLLSDNMLKEPSQRVLLASFAVLLENEPTYAIAPAMNYVLQKSFGLQEASFQALRKNKNVRFFPIMEKALMQKHGKELDRLLKEYVLMAGEIGEEGRIHARNHINNLLKTKNKNDLDYTILIKYRQSLL